MSFRGSNDETRPLENEEERPEISGDQEGTEGGDNDTDIEEIEEEIELDDNELYQVLSTVFEDDSGNGVTSYMGALIKVLQQQNTILAQMADQLNNISASLNRQG